MPEETVQPTTDAPITPVLEAINSTPPEVIIAPAPTETPVEPIPAAESISEPSSVGINQLLGASGEAPPGRTAEPSATRIEASPQSSISENINSQMGGNDPIEPAPAESIPPAPAVETPAEIPVAIGEPVPAETTAPEVPPTETTQSAPAEAVIEITPPQITTEATPVIESADSRLGRRVETPASTPVLEPTNQAPAPAPIQNSEPVVTDLNSPRLNTSEEVPLGRTAEPSATQTDTFQNTPLSENISSPVPETTEQIVSQPVPIEQTPSSIPQVVYTADPNIIKNLLNKARAKIQERKQKKLDKVMALFDTSPQIENKDVQQLLRTSSSTAVRYLDDLEKTNKVKQVGGTGKAVFYVKI